MQLTADQLAGAKEVPTGKAVSDFACFDANVVLAGELPTLLLNRVCTSDGKSRSSSCCNCSEEHDCLSYHYGGAGTSGE